MNSPLFFWRGSGRGTFQHVRVLWPFALAAETGGAALGPGARAPGAPKREVGEGLDVHFSTLVQDLWRLRV